MRDELDCKDKLIAAQEDIAFLRSLLKTIVEEVAGVYGGHSQEAIEAMAIAQKLIQEGKSDGR